MCLKRLVSAPLGLQWLPSFQTQAKKKEERVWVCGGVPEGGGSVQLLSIQLNFPLDSSSSRLKPTTEQNSELGIK